MNFVSDDLNKYCENHSSVPSPACEDIAAHTRAHVPYAQMLTGPLEGSFLGLMVHVVNAKRILEIGTFTGYSALSMAERLPDDGEIITLDVNPETNEIARRFWAKSPHGKKITPILAPGLETLATLKGPFDLVFIDADKTNYLAYFQKALPLLSPRGLILVDNCLWSGRVLEKSPSDSDTQAIQKFNDYVKSQASLECTLLPLRDGVFVIRKKSP